MSKTEKLRRQPIDQLVDGLEAFYQQIDKQLKARLPTLKQPASCPTCTNASPGCCYQKLIMPFHEALPIVRWLKEHKLDTPELRVKLREAGAAMEGLSPKEWFDQQTPCVFLENGRCSVYKVRPIHCRMHVVVSDPACCQNDHPEGDIAVVDVSSVFDQLIARSREIHLSMGLKESDKRLLMGTMPRVLLVALEAFDKSSSDAFADHVRAQVWPSDIAINDGWNEGNNPFRVS